MWRFFVVSSIRLFVCPSVRVGDLFRRPPAGMLPGPIRRDVMLANKAIFAAITAGQDGRAERRPAAGLSRAE